MTWSFIKPFYYSVYALSLLIALQACKSIKDEIRGERLDKAAQSEKCTSEKLSACDSATGSSPKAEVKSISGRCEVMIVGESEAKPCTNLKLMIHSGSLGAREERTATVEGFNFSFTDLTKNSYELVAASPNFELSSDTKTLSPGQTVQIRLNAKPLR